MQLDATTVTTKLLHCFNSLSLNLLEVDFLKIVCDKEKPLHFEQVTNFSKGNPEEKASVTLYTQSILWW